MEGNYLQKAKKYIEKSSVFCYTFLYKIYSVCE